MSRQVDSVRDSDSSNLPLMIFCSSIVGLFAELAIIRLHGAYMPVLALLKNTSLLSCFLGLGLGFAAPDKSNTRIGRFLPMLAAQIAFLRFVDLSGIYEKIGNPLGEENFLGLLPSIGQAKMLALVLIGVIFSWNVLTFIPLGRLIGSLIGRLGGTRSYHYNLLGSLAGVLLFGLVSVLQLGPSVWIIISALFIFPFLNKHRSSLFISYFCAVLAVVALEYSNTPSVHFIFSPYQALKLTLSPNTPPVVSVNNLYYQRMLDFSGSQESKSDLLKAQQRYYDLPISSVPKSPSVLVVGSGTGNDVAAAIRGGAQSITAVEIDPVILQVGKELHPERPYQSPIVTAVNSDARKYIRSSEGQFDLIVYGLLDSHALVSGKSGGLRLDSYVYTVEAFKEARHLLTERGMLSLSFVHMGDAFIKKVSMMLEQAFDGQQPLILKSDYDGALTFMMGNQPKVVGDKWLGFAVLKLGAEEAAVTADPSTDDWPFFYMPRKALPISHLVFLGFVLALCFLFTKPLLSSTTGYFGWRAFWLGAGFMLLETKAITEVSLLWGSVFSVTTVIIASILFLALCANWCLSKGWVKPSDRHFIYLLGAVILSYAVTYLPPGTISSDLEMYLKPLILTLPLFFAGLCFSSEVAQHDTSAMLGANLLGAIIGGLFEYTAMLTGFSVLYIFVFAFYALACLARPKAQV